MHINTTPLTNYIRLADELLPVNSLTVLSIAHRQSQLLSDAELGVEDEKLALQLVQDRQNQLVKEFPFVFKEFCEEGACHLGIVNGERRAE